MVGAVAESQDGKIGVISSIEVCVGKSKPINYKGVTLDGRNWQSECPIIIAKCVNEYIKKFILHKDTQQEELVLI